VRSRLVTPGPFTADEDNDSPSERGRPLIGIALLTLLPGKLGGSETLIRGLLEALAAELGTDRDGQTYAVVTNELAARSLAQYSRGPLQVHTLSGYSPGNGTLTRLLGIVRGRYAGARLAHDFRAAAAEPLSVVHYAVTVSIPPLEVPRVVTVYDLQHEVMPELFSVAERTYRRVFYAGAIADADVIMTISEFSKKTIVERHGVPADRVIVSRQGIDRGLFSPDAEEDDAERVRALGAPDRYVIYPANIWPHKNHGRLLEAMALLDETELGLVLTGERYGRWSSLAATAQALGIGDRVHHLGYVDRGVLPALYRRAAGVVFPSLFEGLGIPPLEALSCGCAVAAAEVAALPEILGRHAIWFDATEPAAIAEGIESLAAGRTPRLPGEEFWRSFTWEQTADTHRSAYRLAGASRN
jgi:glycosyltransferase involved in cell wall biosynthesis